MTAAPGATHDPVDRLAEDFLARYRRGERPSVTDYARQFPDVADQVADLIQVLLLMEKLGEEQIGAGERADDPLPEQLGEYRIVREIGRGGMGVVFEAYQGELGRRVALKVLPAVALLRPTHLARFHREAQAAARLHHTNIVPVFGVGVQDGIYYYAMQRIEGRGLDAVLRELLDCGTASAAETPRDLLGTTPRSGAASSARRPDDAVAIARIGYEIADALAHAHGQGVIHRDVKPSNILLDADGRAWLSDFGLAQFDSAEAVTGTGELVGTLRYMAPERFRSPGDARSDLYSLGLTLYELLTRRPAFAETERARLIHQILAEEPAPPRKLRPAIPRDLETIVLKAITKEPEKRYQSARELADDLGRFLADRPVAARRLGAAERTVRWVRRNAAFSAAASLAFLLLLAGLATTYWQWQRAEREADGKQSAADTANALRVKAEENAALAWRAVRGILGGTSNLAERPAAAVRETMLQEALKFYQEYLAHVTERPRLHESGLIARELGRIRHLLGDVNGAEPCFRQAIQSFRDLSQSDPSDDDARLQLAISLTDCATLFDNRDATRFPEMERFSRESIDLLHALLDQQPEHTLARFTLAKSLYNLSTARSAQGLDWQEPIDDSLRQLQRLCSVAQPDTWHLVRLSQYARSYCIRLVADKRLDDARIQGELAVRAAGQLTTLYRKESEYQDLLGECCSALGTVQLRQHAFPEAEATFKRAVLVRRALLEKDPYNARGRSELGAALNELASAVSRQHRQQNVIPLLKEAVEQQRLAMELVPSSLAYQYRMSIHQKQLAAVWLQQHRPDQAAEAAAQLGQLPRARGSDSYDAAVLLCQCAADAARDNTTADHQRQSLAYQASAVAQLQEAVRRGFVDRGKLQAAPLRILHDRADYQQLLAELPAKTAQSK